MAISCPRPHFLFLPPDPNMKPTPKAPTPKKPSGDVGWAGPGSLLPVGLPGTSCASITHVSPPPPTHFLSALPVPPHTSCHAPCFLLLR